MNPYSLHNDAVRLRHILMLLAVIATLAAIALPDAAGGRAIASASMATDTPTNTPTDTLTATATRTITATPTATKMPRSTATPTAKPTAKPIATKTPKAP